MNDKLLKVLVVHDTIFQIATPGSILRTEDLDLCEIERMSGLRESYVRSWEAVLEILSGEAVFPVAPDLLLVDARFEKDTTAPPCSGDFSGAGLRRFESTQAVDDPRGILYGAIVLARLIGVEGMPTGFCLYSMDLPSISENPYAQTFYGLLRALGDEVVFPVRRGKDFEREMKSATSAGEPDSVWPEALQRYRESLWGALGRLFSPNYESFARAAQVVRAYVERRVKDIPEDLEISWLMHDARKRVVLLRSLYADCRIRFRGWDRSLIEKSTIVNDLESIADRRWRLDLASVPSRIYPEKLSRFDMWIWWRDWLEKKTPSLC